MKKYLILIGGILLLLLGIIMVVFVMAAVGMILLGGKLIHRSKSIQSQFVPAAQSSQVMERYSY